METLQNGNPRTQSRGRMEPRRTGPNMDRPQEGPANRRSTPRIKRWPAWMAVSAIILAALAGATASAGEDFQNLKACLEHCINTTDPLTAERFACVLDCYANYVDDKISVDPPRIGQDPFEAGDGMVCDDGLLGEYPHAAEYPFCFGLAGVPFDLRVRTHEPAVAVEIWSMTDGDDGFFFEGLALPDELEPDMVFHWLGASESSRAYLAVARFTTDPEEDLDHAAVLLVSLEMPTPADSGTWGEIKALFR